jgi:UDP-N-acetylglucosamine 4,6-dehydratase
MTNHKDKTVLITGGTGTFGHHFVEHALSNGMFRKIVILSRDEFKQFHMKSHLDVKHPGHNVNFIIGDVRDESRLETAFRGVDYVINAAALKHVPVCEYNPQEAVKTNVSGTMNVCSAASKTGVKQVIHLSTDKAVEPINFYGATKQLAEKYVIHANNFSFGTKLSAVRYGNIIGSRGSIIETILKNVNSKKPINITDIEMTRFWLPIDNAVQMVIWALQNMLGGEVVIPFAGASNILDMAEAVCTTVSKQFEYTVGGIRPGEKIHEQLIARNEFDRSLVTKCGKYTIIKPENPQWDEKLIEQLESLHTKKLNRDSFSSADKDFLLTKYQLLELIKDHCDA